MTVTIYFIYARPLANSGRFSLVAGSKCCRQDCQLGFQKELSFGVFLDIVVRFTCQGNVLLLFQELFLMNSGLIADFTMNEVNRMGIKRIILVLVFGKLQEFGYRLENLLSRQWKQFDGIEKSLFRRRTSFQMSSRCCHRRCRYSFALLSDSLGRVELAQNHACPTDRKAQVRKEQCRQIPTFSNDTVCDTNATDRRRQYESDYVPSSSHPIFSHGLQPLVARSLVEAVLY